MTDELAWALHRLALALFEVDLAVARRLGVSSVEYTAIKHVAMSDRPVGPGEIAQLVGVSSGSATELVDRLQRVGHVHRRPDPHDGRRRVVHLTPTTVRRLETELRAASVGVGELADELPPELTRSLTDVLGRLSGRLTDWARTASRPHGGVR
ncbi:MarR family winged helix-turn-helix transcriptional regulator [Actinophytocola oryzae]|uniref:MarR family winged helix-turn-helix transcriptional regulator n=1 Tax=Actinophytocola oryzae TaxID=502181 RepID=UPI0010627423|nr:MarR family winged helix-turn-helix transcriptional regulator [Actinophytocola oryzae]